MKTFRSIEEWRGERLLNYASKLRISKPKAIKRLSLFCTPEKLRFEFDRICDSQFRSNKEPGLSSEERKERTRLMYTPKRATTQRATQLTLFNLRLYDIETNRLPRNRRFKKIHVQP